MKRKYNLLFHPVFLISILLLLINDIFLKYAFPNWLTGKLSDFTGLFAFAVFLLVFFPNNKKHVIFCCALFFLWWKSSLSQGLIDGINTFSPFTLDRVVDYTDLTALLILPLAYTFSYSSFTPRIQSRALLNIACVISLFAFCNTTGPRNIMYQYPRNYISFYEDFPTGKTEEEILQKLSFLQLKYSIDSLHYYRLLPADLYLRKNITDSGGEWRRFSAIGDSALYIKEKESPFYIISAYSLDGDNLTNLEFRFEKGKKKNRIRIQSFQTNAHDQSVFYSGKIKRKYKKHFKELFN